MEAPMTNLTDDDTQKHPYRSLGLRFWLPWGAAFLANLAAFFGFVRLDAPLLEQPLRAIALGAAVILFTLALVGINMLPHRTAQKRGWVDPLRPAMRRYQWRFMIPMLLYVVALVAATYYWKSVHPTGLVAVLVALAPAVPVLFAIRAMFLWLREENDEYLRARMFENWTLAALLAMAVCTVIGFLDQFRVIPHIPLWAALPLWAVCIGPVQLLFKGRCA